MLNPTSNALTCRAHLLILGLLFVIAPASLLAAEEGDGVPPSEGASDPVLEALEAELSRAMELLSKQDPAPYFLALEAQEGRSVSITGEEGGLQGYRPQRGRIVQPDLRLGTPQLDSTHPLRDGSIYSGGGGGSLPIGDDVDVLRRVISREIDEAYREARERYQRVLTEQQVKVDEELSWDLAPTEPVVDLQEPKDPGKLDLESVETLVRAASAVFTDHPSLLDPSVSFVVDERTQWFVSSEGHRIRHYSQLFRLAVTANAIDTDGTAIDLFRSVDFGSPADLPSKEEVVATAEEIRKVLDELLEAPEEEPYQGPAILSGRASAVFFHEIFGHRVEGHRLKQVDDAQTFKNRVGERILPSFLSVYDDPTRKVEGGPFLRGSYQYDNQGVKAEPVTLVEDGVLQGFLESRSTVTSTGRSNAHGRRQPGAAPVSRQGNLIIETTNSVSTDELRRRLKAAAKKQGLDHALWIDDIAGGFTFTDRDIPNAFQIDVIEASRIYVDGRPDERIRGIDLIGTPLQTFGQIQAASDEVQVFNGSCGAESGWVPVSAQAPALLVAQIETQRKAKGQERPPLLPAPGALGVSGSSDQPILNSLVAIAQWSKDSLQMEGMPRPARVELTSLDHIDSSATADFGNLRTVAGTPKRGTAIEVIVGDDALNSSRVDGGGIASLPSAIQSVSLSVDSVPEQFSRDLWLAADRSYKAALQRLGFKVAMRKSAVGTAPPPDWSPAKAQVQVNPIETKAPNSEAIQSLAQELSAQFRGIGLRNGTVTVRTDQGRSYRVSTDGTQLIQPEGFAVVYAHADLLRDDGLRLFDRLQWVARSLEELPPKEEMATAIQAMGRDLKAREGATELAYYEGPVLFEGEAAADFFRYLLPRWLRGTPPAPEAGKSYEQQTRRGPREGRRLLPDGWTVLDDPQAQRPGLAGGFAFDHEGVPAQAVSLVEDGYVTELLRTRVPRADGKASNGHARGQVGAHPSGRLSHWSVLPSKALSKGAMKRKLHAAMKDARSDRVLVVYRMEQGRPNSLPRPSHAVWRLADGREEPVLSLEFQGVDRRTLRDVVAAGGGLQLRPYLDPQGGSSRAPTTKGMPMSIQAPEQLLVAGVEVAFPGASKEPTILPLPPWTEE